MLFRLSLKDILRHPNTLTIIRIVATPAIVLLLLIPDNSTLSGFPDTFKNRLASGLAAILFSAAAITDFFDGFVARKRGLVSELGKSLDPLADKILVCCALIMLSALKWAPAWLVCLIISREIAVTGLRGIVAEKVDVSATWLGKFKTGFQIAAIIPLLIHYSYFGIDFNLLGTIFLWLALLFTIWSGVDYFNKFFRVITVEDQVNDSNQNV